MAFLVGQGEDRGPERREPAPVDRCVAQIDGVHAGLRTDGDVVLQLRRSGDPLGTRQLQLPDELVPVVHVEEARGLVEEDDLVPVRAVVRRRAPGLRP
jgi:hypothetical protein